MPGLEWVAAQGADPYAVLVGTVLSLRTRDATALPALERLRALAPDAAALAALEVEAIATAIHPVAFYRVKAASLRRLAAQLLSRHQGQVPADMEALLALPGVGRKTANLVLGLGFGQPAVCVDTHVHRILNRLGALRSRHADETEALLRRHLPPAWWLRVNPVLVAFGQTVCLPRSPWCSRCPLHGDGASGSGPLAVCARLGVLQSR